MLGGRFGTAGARVVIEEFMIGEDLRAAASGVTPWIALGSLLAGCTTYYFHQAFTLGRRTELLLLVMTVPAVANVLLNLALIPAFGVTGPPWRPPPASA